MSRSNELNKHRQKNFQIHHLYQEYTTNSAQNSPSPIARKLNFFGRDTLI
jgi:hypothetical protein